MARDRDLGLVRSVFGMAMFFAASLVFGQQVYPLPAGNDEAGFEQIFDGKTLVGWEGDPKYWRVENGCLVGEVTPETILKQNSFIIWRRGTPRDFELKVEYRVSARGNSGINYRSVEIPNTTFALRGYQADIDGANKYTGQNYEEKGRTFLALRGDISRADSDGKARIIGSVGDKEALAAHVKNEDWNQVHLVVRGNVMTHLVNGHVMSVVVDDDPERRKFDGLLGVQVHVGPPMKIEYRNFQLKPLAGGPQFGAAPPRDRQNQPGPWDNDVLVYRLTGEGRTERLATFERAGVPTVTRLENGRLIAAFQHFPQDDNRNFDRVAVAFSLDEGKTWSKPEPIVVEGLEQGLARPFDPTLVLLADGRVRMYFTSNRSPDFRRSTPAIYSAVSEDGVRYKFEPGVRLAVEGRIVIDCAAALHKGMVHLIVPDNGTADQMMRGQQGGQPPRGGTGYHAVSRDGLMFERVDDVALANPRDRWLGNMQSDGDRLVFFGTGPGPWPVASTDGKSWSAADHAARIPGADPGAVKLRDGSWLLLVTSPPRPGTPSARQRPQPPLDGPRPPNPPPPNRLE